MLKKEYEVEKKKNIMVLATFIVLLSLIGLLSNSDVVKSAYCDDEYYCSGGCLKCVWNGDQWVCRPETIKKGYFCFCSDGGGGSQICELSYTKICRQAI